MQVAFLALVVFAVFSGVVGVVQIRHPKARRHPSAVQHAHKSSHHPPTTHQKLEAGAAPVKAAHSHHQNASHQQHHFMAVAKKRKGSLKCYVNEAFQVPLGDGMQDCDAEHDRCLVRVVVREDTGAVEARRYCSSSQLCHPYTNAAQGWVSHITATERSHAMCCNGDGCNAGVPAMLSAGLYWIRPYDDDTRFLTWSPSESKFFLDDFKNTESQKWRVEIASQANGVVTKYSIIPEGVYEQYMDDSSLEQHVAAFSTKGWTIAENDYWTYQVNEEEATPSGIFANLLPDKTGHQTQFSLTPTLYSWGVGAVGQRCPERALAHDATNVQACKDKCLQDPACQVAKMIEWDAVEEKCYMVHGKCTDDSLSKAGDFLYRFQSKCATVVCQETNQCQFAGQCNEQRGRCMDGLLKPSGTPCNDGHSNTVEDQCAGDSLVCVGEDRCAGKPPCEAPQCHSITAGAQFSQEGCDRQTGLCVFQIDADGTECDDMNPATVRDACVQGLCVGQDLCAANPCEPLNECHTVGPCNKLDGTCPQNPKSDDTPCDDGNDDSSDDKCVSGVCTGKVDKCADISCEAASGCHVAGECEAATGMCSNPFADEGTDCDDNSPLTAEDKCDGSGACSGQDLCKDVSCAAESDCQVEGSCDPGTGQCRSILKPDGAVCGAETDSHKHCVAGACEDVDRCLGVVCPHGDQCNHASECEASNGQCLARQPKSGDSCDDGSPNTDDDQCVEQSPSGTPSVSFALCVGTVPSPEDVADQIPTGDLSDDRADAATTSLSQSSASTDSTDSTE